MNNPGWTPAEFRSVATADRAAVAQPTVSFSQGVVPSVYLSQATSAAHFALPAHDAQFSHFFAVPAGNFAATSRSTAAIVPICTSCAEFLQVE